MRIRALLLLVLLCPPAAAATLQDYLPDDVTYDPGIPEPKSILGFEVGEWHVRHDQLVAYINAVAAASDRVQIEITGRTHEQRPLLLLTVSSPENLASIDEIRRQRQSGSDDGPLVVWEGFSVHGNEASGANAALLFVYYLAAARGEKIDELLDTTIVLVDPVLNPDGLGRFAQWANTHGSRTPNADPGHRVHHEVWPNGRTNHYWFDLNRDWILLVHPETRARVAKFHEWRPHVLTDFHEMWSNSTFFFQPGVPSRLNPLTPERNQQLTQAIGRYHAAALDELGQLYFTEEVFDDFYFGKGSSYPDINGAIGILFEQASSRGQLIETVYGELDFPTTVRNQLATSLSTLRASYELRDELREYRRDFYAGARERARRDPVAAYVIGDGGDPARAHHFVDLLLRHDIEVHELAREITVGENTYEPEHAWTVPTDQRQYLLLESLMERRTTFNDETFYDVSAWTLPLAFNLPFAELSERQASGAVGAGIDSVGAPEGSFADTTGAIAYAFEWTGYYAPRALQRLLAEELLVYAAIKPFVADAGDARLPFGRGSIVVPTGLQGDKREKLVPALETIAAEDGIDVHTLSTALTPTGIDLGSPNLRRVKPVKPLVVVGPGVRGNEVGEAWHLLDTRVGLPLSMIDTHRLRDTDLGDYTHVVLVDGKYDRLGDKEVERLDAWIRNGGILVAVKGGAKWATEKKLHVKKKKDEEESDEEEGPDKEEEKEPDADPFRAYDDFRNDRSKRRISGAIFEVHLDNTHPVGFGYEQERLAVFRNGTYFLEPGDNPYETVTRYTDSPLLGGYIGEERLEQLLGSASLVATRVDKGAVIRIADSLNFRGIWYGTNRLFLNALYFGQVIDATKLD